MQLQMISSLAICAKRYDGVEFVWHDIDSGERIPEQGVSPLPGKSRYARHSVSRSEQPSSHSIAEGLQTFSLYVVPVLALLVVMFLLLCSEQPLKDHVRGEMPETLSCPLISAFKQASGVVE